MKLYNTLTRKIDSFTPRDGKNVNLFVCGPTVYDFSHLGHAKTYIQMDILARVLRQKKYEVFYLQNITDLDDKIIARSQEKGISWEELRTTYEKEYFTDMQSLNNTAISQYARATDHIEDIIGQIQVLLDKKHAYHISDGIYFEIATFEGYGQLSGRSEVQANDAQTRIDQSSEKRGWNDFCLWKFSKPGEPVWDAPFGKGRPGWHIEDTAITEHFFGPQYDIHGGAVDLIFPHHEAEITQMESASGKSPMVKTWVHTGFLNIDNTKMSKSIGNFYTIREVLDKGIDPMTIRLFMLQSHYRSPINFTWDNLHAAGNRLQSYRAMADHSWQTTNEGTIDSNNIEGAKNDILKALFDDLNTPAALTRLSQLETDIDDGGINISCRDTYKTFLNWLDSTLGLGLAKSIDITDVQKKLITERQLARHDRNWVISDEIRDNLAQQGIALKDNRYGQIWWRI